jgi:hypothetical protein
MGNPDMGRDLTGEEIDQEWTAKRNTGSTQEIASFENALRDSGNHPDTIRNLVDESFEDAAVTEASRRTLRKAMRAENEDEAVRLFLEARRAGSQARDKESKNNDEIRMAELRRGLE